MRHTDQFHVGEHYARPFVAIVEQHGNAGGGEGVMQAVGRFPDRSTLGITDGHDGNVKRRDGLRENNAAFVVVLLDRGGHDTRDTDTVAAHFHDLRFAGLVEEGEIHRFRVFGAQLENVADFNAAANLQRAFAVGRGVTGYDVTDVGKHGLGEIAADVHVGQVVIVFIGADNKAGHCADGAVGNDCAAESDGTERAGVGLESGAYGFRRSECHRLLHLRQFAGLDHVQFVVAAHQQQHRFAVGAVNDHRFDGKRCGQLQKCAELSNGLDARGMHLLHHLCGGRARRGRRNGFGEFNVGRVVRLRAVGDGVFAGVGEHMEFMRSGAADRAGVGSDGAEFQSQSRENAAVGVVHVAVFAQKVVVVHVEGIGVLHQELAAAHHAETRTDLVAELGLDLVQIER